MSVPRPNRRWAWLLLTLGGAGLILGTAPGVWPALGVGLLVFTSWWPRRGAPGELPPPSDGPHPTPAAQALSAAARLVRQHAQEADEARARLDHTRRWFEDVIKQAPTAMLVVDEAGRIVWHNQEVTTLLGYEASELIGQPVELLVPEAQRPGHPAMVRSFFRGAMPQLRVGRELNAAQRGGGWVPIELHLTRLEGDGGPQALAVVLDRRAQRAVEAELRAQRLELERSNRELADFVYLASHDLRSPLRAVANLARWIQEDAGPSLPPDSAVHLEKLEARVQRMQGLLDAILDYSRLRNQDNEPEEVALGPVIERVVALLHTPPGFVVEVRGVMPVLRTHPWPLEQCLRNLVSNAVVHHDRPDGRVTLTVAEEGDWISITVEDDGPGIPAELQSQVFGVLTRIRRDARVGGMGLAIVKRAVELHGGTVRLESAAGEGARFTFTWPKRPLSP